jgi:hypothetical protein
MINQFPQNRWPQPGSIVSTPMLLLFRHTGIVSDQFSQGKPTVISNSARAGGVYEETWDDFAQGKKVYVEGRPSIGSGQEIVRRARTYIGTRYVLLKWNCEHFVACAIGKKVESKQLDAVVVALLACGVIWATTAR